MAYLIVHWPPQAVKHPCAPQSAKPLCTGRRRRGILPAAAHRTRSRAVLVYRGMPQHLHLNAQNRTSRRPTDFNSPKFVKVSPAFGEAARIQRRVALAAVRRRRNPFTPYTPTIANGTKPLAIVDKIKLINQFSFFFSTTTAAGMTSASMLSATTEPHPLLPVFPAVVDSEGFGVVVS